MSSKRMKVETEQVMEYIPPELNLFTSQPVQTSILSESVVKYNPLTTLDKCSNIQFLIPSIKDKYINLNRIDLKLQLQIIKNDGTTFAEEDKDIEVYLINNCLHSIFKKLTIEMNDQIVSNTQFYHYKSYLENLLNFQKGSAENLMQTQGFYLDTQQHFDEYENNSGAKARYAATKNSKTIELYGKIMSDVFNIQRYLISDVDIKINFDLEKKDFYFMKMKDESTAVLKISEATVFVCYKTISPTMLLAHHKMLQSRNASYNFKRTSIKNFLIPGGVNTFNIENIFSGQLPTNLLMMFLENDAYYGNMSKNPYNFKTFDIGYLQLNVNGNNVPNHPLTLNSSSGLVSKAYHDLHLGLNYTNKDFGLLFNMEAFKNGFGIFAFDLTPTKKHSVINLSDNGILKAELKFHKTTDKPILMLVYAEFPSSFEVTSTKNIIVNY